jgi:hypothetical protein
MSELEYLIKHGGLTPKQLLRKITRRGFSASVLSSLVGAASSRIAGAGPAPKPGADFTIAIIPDPQYLAASCPDGRGGYYSAMMQWVVDNRNLVLASSHPPFKANVKALVGVGDCVNTANGNEFGNAQAAWTILDKNGVAFITPPGNHDYANGPSSRSNLGAQFSNGFFSARSRSRVYGAGISLGDQDAAYWIGSFDATGANTAVKFVISGMELLFLAMDFFAGNAAWAWAYDVMLAHPACECYITTHAWLTTNGTQYQRADGYGPNTYSMARAPYSNSAAEAWETVGVKTWSNLFGVFSGHDLMGSRNTDPLGTASPAWFWQHEAVRSQSPRKQDVHQLFVNSQELDLSCGMQVSRATGAGQLASVFLLTRRLELGLMEGRMVSTRSGNWFEPRAKSFPEGTSWNPSETLLFSIPFAGLKKP